MEHIYFSCLLLLLFKLFELFAYWLQCNFGVCIHIYIHTMIKIQLYMCTNIYDHVL